MDAGARGPRGRQAAAGEKEGAERQVSVRQAGRWPHGCLLMDGLPDNGAGRRSHLLVLPDLLVVLELVELPHVLQQLHRHHINHRHHAVSDQRRVCTPWAWRSPPLSSSPSSEQSPEPRASRTFRASEEGPYLPWQVEDGPVLLHLAHKRLELLLMGGGEGRAGRGSAGSASSVKHSRRLLAVGIDWYLSLAGEWLWRIGQR